jgi:hypothetical protein
MWAMMWWGIEKWHPLPKLHFVWSFVSFVPQKRKEEKEKKTTSIRPWGKWYRVKPHGIDRGLFIYLFIHTSVNPVHNAPR